MATATVPTASRAWTFEKTSSGPWPGSREPQRDRYWAARRRPTCRNRGPAGRGFGDWVKTYHIVLPTLQVDPGDVLPDGLIVPAVGAVLHHVPLAPPLHSGGQAKKLLRKLRMSFPEAQVWESRNEPGHGMKGPSISAPGAPAGWFEARAAASLTPCMTWRQFAAEA